MQVNPVVSATRLAQAAAALGLGHFPGLSARFLRVFRRVKPAPAASESAVRHKSAGSPQLYGGVNITLHCIRYICINPIDRTE